MSAAALRVAIRSSSAHGVRGNEDLAGATSDAAFVLDGAGMGDIRSICRHGVRWYTRRLGAALEDELTRGGHPDLGDVLGAAVARVADAHRGSCDIADPRSPNATVAIVRLRGARWEYLVLGDCVIAFDRSIGGPLVITDGRERELGREVREAYDAAPEGTPERERARRRAIDFFRSTRNRPGGFWVAKDDPIAAQHALRGAVPTAEASSAALATNGLSRLVDPWQQAGWGDILARLANGRVRELIRDVRRSERARPAEADDATVVFCRPSAPGVIPG